MENINRLFDCTGKVAVVTGGSGHLGKAMVLSLLELNAQVYVLGTNEKKYNEVFAEQLSSSKIAFIEVDILNTESVKAAIKKIAANESKINILINNAFTIKSGNALQLSDEEFNSAMNGCILSAYRFIREAVEYMPSGSSIINIASMYGIVSPDFKVYEATPQFLNPPHYGIAKAGIIQMTKYFAAYLAHQNIRVNAIAPGAFPNETVQQSGEFMAALKNKIPLNRIGTPEDLKGVVALLSSNASKFITGQTLVVDGGWTII
ncbi:MAG: hypothetical protein RJA07_2034 [Bacteroidota bacterium]|jgi:gluconate 5-dehydrogenase